MKSEDQGRGTERGGPLDGPRQDLLVAQVDAVENADRQRTALKAGVHVVQIAQEFHKG